MSKFDLLEQKLNIATELIEELELVDYEIAIPTLTSAVSVPREESTTEIFSLETLKSDFVMIRQNVMKLISTGQRVLDSASLIDPSDMKASQLMALSQLQQTLGTNIQLLVSIYKEIAGIEKVRSTINNKTTENGSVVNQGTVINNNVLFSGSTTDLLSFMHEQKNAN
jgi:hypothetical protein